MFNILVVEDDPIQRRLMKAVLGRAGYTVHIASNGREGLELLDEQHVDLVVLDVMMPEMDGYEFSRTIRQGNSTLPILMVSAKQTQRDKREGFLAGTDDYMTKPVDEEEMLWRITALLRRSRIASEKKITVGKTVLDHSGMTVSENGTVSQPPQKEFLLLLLCSLKLFSFI